MLQTKTDAQLKKVLSIFEKSRTNVIQTEEDGLYIDDFIAYDDMAEIVDYLRTLAPKDELFEECWKAYNRKGSKKKSLEYWKKLTDVEKQNVMPHIKAYVSTRELQFQKDFERYLRDKIFTTVVFSNNAVVYDPTKVGKGEAQGEVYMPTCGGCLHWNEYYHTYLYVGMWFGYIADGYTDDNRPDGATVMLNNGQGTVRWSRERKVWDLEKV